MLVPVFADTMVSNKNTIPVPITITSIKFRKAYLPIFLSNLSNKGSLIFLVTNVRPHSPFRRFYDEIFSNYLFYTVILHTIH